jgi:uncharacterized protein (DUF2141 family)
VRHRPRRLAALTLASLGLAATASGAEAPTYDVTAVVSGLRSSKGQVLACLTQVPATYPDCDKDPNAHKLKVPAGATVTLDFGAVPAGVYAISVIHDENGNGKLDKRMMMPAEGYGFSRDAPVHFGPPSFKSASFTVNAPQQQTIKMRYMF